MYYANYHFYIFPMGKLYTGVLCRQLMVFRRRFWIQKAEQKNGKVWMKQRHSSSCTFKDIISKQSSQILLKERKERFTWKIQQHHTAGPSPVGQLSAQGSTEVVKQMWPSARSSLLRAADFTSSRTESVPLEHGTNQKERAGWSDCNRSHQANRWGIGNRRKSEGDHYICPSCKQKQQARESKWTYWDGK